MLEERATAADLRGADHLAAPDEHLAADRGGEAGARADSRHRRVGRERGVEADATQRGGEPLVDRAVTVPERSEAGDRRGDGVGDLVLVPDGPAACGAADTGCVGRAAICACAMTKSAPQPHLTLRRGFAARSSGTWIRRRQATQ